jgi:hypothetical protein
MLQNIMSYVSDVENTTNIIPCITMKLYIITDLFNIWNSPFIKVIIFYNARYHNFHLAKASHSPNIQVKSGAILAQQHFKPLRVKELSFANIV